MSASSRPTDAPAWASATARLTLTVLLPTPPLPDATAMMFLTPGTSCSAWRGCERRTMAPQVMSTFVAPIAPRAAFVVRSISSLSGQAGVVSSMVIDRAEPSMTTSLTMSRVIEVAPELGLLDGAHRIDDGVVGEAGHRRWVPSVGRNGGRVF